VVDDVQVVLCWACVLLASDNLAQDKVVDDVQVVLCCCCCCWVLGLGCL